MREAFVRVAVAGVIVLAAPELAPAADVAPAPETADQEFSQGQADDLLLVPRGFVQHQIVARGVIVEVLGDGEALLIDERDDNQLFVPLKVHEDLFGYRGTLVDLNLAQGDVTFEGGDADPDTVGSGDTEPLYDAKRDFRPGQVVWIARSETLRCAVTRGSGIRGEAGLSADGYRAPAERYGAVANQVITVDGWVHVHVNRINELEPR